MLADGDRVLIAVSGGIDSLVLAVMLSHWLTKAPISYEVLAIHIDMDGKGGIPGHAANTVAGCLAELSIPCAIMEALYRPDEKINPGEQKQHQVGNRNSCFQCARSRRRQLFSYARDHGFNKLALGHHRDDLIETFFLNLFYSGNISTMVPKQVFFSGNLSIIRPMAYLDKDEIKLLGKEYSLSPIRFCCPLEEHTKRAEVRTIIANIDQQIPGVKKQIVAAMANVRSEYLLKPTGR